MYGFRKALFCVALLALAVVAYPKDKKDAAPDKQQVTAVAPTMTVPTPELTVEEKEILQLNQDKINAINKRIADFNERLKLDEEEVAQERASMVKSFLKAHALDAKDWDLAPDGKFVAKKASDKKP